jgi:hypothetical protein
MKYFRFRNQQEVLKMDDRLFVFAQRNEGDRIIETDEFGDELSDVVKPKPEDKSVITPEQIAELTKPVELKEKKNAIKGAYKQRQKKNA